MEFDFNPKPVRKVCSRIGLALCVIIVLTYIAQIPFSLIPGILDYSWGKWVVSFLPMYLIAVPVGLLTVKRLPKEAPPSQKMKLGSFFVILLISYCLMYGGNIIGTVLSLILSGGTAENALLDYAMDHNPLKILIIVVLAPLVEEYIFRKQIIDRTRRFGEKTAVFLSALAFGLFHMNLFQFFYAFALGMVFGYVYIRYGRLRYTVILHAIINFMGSVIGPFILSMIDQDAMMSLANMTDQNEILSVFGEILPGMLLLSVYSMLIMGFCVAGLVLLIIKRKNIVWREAEAQLPKGAAIKTVYGNVGMILFILLCLSLTAANLFL